MKDKEVEELVELRNLILRAYDRLEKSTSRNVAIMKQADAAEIYEASIRKIDSLLKSYVNFN
jgi:hypothetical protein